MYQPRSHHGLSILCFASTLAACVGIGGNGQRTSESRDIGDFTKLVADGPFDVQVTQGESTEVQVNVDSNLQGKVKTSVRDDTLQIQADGTVFDLIAGPHVVVTVPHLIDVQLIGSGNVIANDFDERDDVRLRDSGSGDLSFKGSAPHLLVELTASGDVWVSGTTDAAEYHLRGSGDLDARDMVASGATIDLNGSGDLRATVNGTVDATQAGSGDIDLFGDAQTDHVTKHGSGDLELH